MKKVILPFFISFIALLCHGQQTTGLFQMDAEVDDGFILWTAILNGHQQYLMNNCGEIVHTWSTPATVPANSMYLQEDGTMFQIAKADTAVNHAIRGGGASERILKLDWNGTVLWDYILYNATQRLHHDMEVLPNGNVLAIVWEIVDSASCVALGRNPERISSGVLWNERIVEIEPTGPTTGNIVWEWSMFDHLIQDFDPTKANYGVVADHPELLNINWLNTHIADSARDDFAHLNSVAYNAELNQIVLSSQVMNEFWIIDHSTTTAEAALHSGGIYGKGGDFLYRYGNPQVYGRGTAADQRSWRQHDAKWIPAGYPDAGSIMIFNNGLDRPQFFSEIDVVTPPQTTPGVYELLPGQAYGPDTKTWNYHATDSTSFYSYFISGASRSATGNTLICAGETGRLFEVTHAGEKVWEYVSPVYFAGILSSTSPIPLAGNGAYHGNLVFRAERYPADFAAFNGRDLSTGVQLESNPFIACLVGGNELTMEGDLRIYPNPTVGPLFINDQNGAQLTLYDISGRMILTEQISSNKYLLDLSLLKAGIYAMQFNHRDRKMVKQLVIQ